MAKRIVFIHGGPRKNGNTRAMTKIAVDAARKRGAKVVEIDATEIKSAVPGCLGCQKCQESKEFACSIGDELAKTVSTLPQYDAIVLATPIYWWSYTAQLKVLIDRLYSLSKFREEEGIRSALTGKTLALLATGTGPLEDNLDLLERQMKNAADMLGCPFLSCLFPDTNVDAGELSKDSEAFRKAAEFGWILAGEQWGRA